MKRRDFLKTAAVAAPIVVNGISVQSLHAHPMMRMLQQSTNDNILVLINMNGGNDGLNTVLPLNQYSNLSAARSNVLIPSNQALSLSGQSNVGFHPAMSGMRDLYNQGKMSVVQSVGYPNPNFSHFRSTDIWASASDANQVVNSGWAGRFLEHEYPGYPNGYPNTNDPDPLAIQLGSVMPLMFMGASSQMALTISSGAIFNGWTVGINDTYPGQWTTREINYMRSIATQTQAYAGSVLNSFTSGNNLATYGQHYLSQLLKLVARMISGGLKTRIFLVSIGGWDTHADQVVNGATTTGGHANLLQALSDAIYSFQTDLQLLGVADKVLGMTFSEFGRRIKSNASLGTDHGAAAPMFLFGNKVQAGVLGANPTIPSTVSVNDNVPMQYDFRSVYGSVLKDWFCIPQADIDNILLQNFQTLPLVQAACTTSILEEVQANQDLISVSNYPNPFITSTTIKFKTLGGHTMVSVFDPLGRELKRLVDKDCPAGEYEVGFENEGFTAGTYYCRLQNGALQQVQAMQIVR